MMGFDILTRTGVGARYDKGRVSESFVIRAMTRATMIVFVLVLVFLGKSKLHDPTSF